LAVDERYTRLARAVTSDPVFDGDLLDRMRSVIVDDGPVHATAFAAIRDSLADVVPADCLRATRRDPADAFEGCLLDISDHGYALTVDALQEQFAQQAGFSSPAVSAMEGLDAINRVLVQRGLLPAFSPLTARPSWRELSPPCECEALSGISRETMTLWQ
jgi:hypothetical protein